MTAAGMRGVAVTARAAPPISAAPPGGAAPVTGPGADDGGIPSLAPAEVLDRLAAAGHVTESDRARVARLAETTAEPLAAILTKLGLVTESDLAAALAGILGLPLADADTMAAAPPPDDAAAIRFLQAARLLPLADDGTTLTVAVADPLDGFALRALALRRGRRLALQVAVPAEIEAALRRADDGPPAVAEADDGGAVDDDAAEADVARLRDLAAEAPVVRYVNRLIGDAAEARASDIHVVARDHGLRVRIRVDGLLRDVAPPPPGHAAAVLSRLKLMANLDIAERRLPQDGRIRVSVRGKAIDLRAATLPTLHGESVVLRILDKTAVRLELGELGFAGPSLARYLGMLDLPTGIVLVTGPTGSGKTTTLYASLVRLNSPERNILTVEDPVEYALEGISQMPVRPRIGLDFANALRHLVRQDPDIILVGEIRDLATAEIAGQAALTGHKVLSTLHTNDAASSVTRLLDMGVADYLVTSTLNGVVAQRLVRRLCPSCRVAAPPGPDLAGELARAGIARPADAATARPQGCPACDGTGYRGRLAIHEVLVMSDTLRRLVLGHAEARELQRAAVAEGMAPIYRNGLERVAAGDTTFEEVLRVSREP